MKMAFIVNSSLNMGKGKIASQVAHGAVMSALKYNQRDGFSTWLGEGQPKIVVKADEAELERISKLVKFERFPFTEVFDAGHTQVEAGSFTVLAIGPSSNKKIDGLIGHLKLI